MRESRPLSLVLHIATLAMEMSCLYLGLALLRQGLGFGSLTFALILLVYALPSVLSLITARSAEPAKPNLVFEAGLGVVIVSAIAALAVWGFVAGGNRAVAAAGIPGIGLQIGLGGLSWWLGNSLVRHEMGYHNICARFQVGILALLVLAIAEGKTFLPVILFFILAIFALALARWQTSVSASGGVLRGPPVRWLVLGSMAVIVPGAIIFFGLSPEIARAIPRWLWAGGSSLVRLLGLDQPRPSQGEPIEWWWSWSCAPKCSSQEEGTGLPKEQPRSDLPGLQVPPILVWLGLVAIFVAVLFFVIVATRREKARRGPRLGRVTAFETESIPMGLLKALAAFARAIAKALRGLLLFVLSLGRLRHARPVQRDEQVFSIRALYRSLLHWAAEQGLPRAPSHTPLEYLKLLCQRFPEKGGELAIVTNAYVEARYGRGPASSEGLDAAKTAWQKVKSESKPHTSAA